MADNTGIHGLAAAIRSAQDNETFDLAGQNDSTIASTISSAFHEPFTNVQQHDKMIRITLIVGAGKHARQRYDDNAIKVVTASLRDCGYQEDKAASCIMECAGTYKLQHDTAKNLKTIVIFPKMSLTDNNTVGTKSSSLSNDPTTNKMDSLIPHDSPEYKIAVCSSMKTFDSMIKRQCPSWIQKKGCLSCIEQLRSIMTSLDEKLVKGIILNDEEQEFYNTATYLDDKEKYLKDEMLQHIEKGNITVYEKEMLLEQNEIKIKELEKQNKSTTKALQRKELLQKVTPIANYHPLKYDNEIRKLQKELIPLIQLAEQTKKGGKLLTIAETTKLTKKDEIEAMILQYEHDSRGWYESDHDYNERIKASRQVITNAKSRSAANVTKKAMPSGSAPRSYAAATMNSNPKSSSPTNTKWALPTATKGSQGSYGPKSKANNKGGSLFTAMMSRQDDDDDDDDEDGNMQEPGYQQPIADKKRSVTAPTLTENTPFLKEKKGKSPNKTTVFTTLEIDSESDDADEEKHEDRAITINDSPSNDLAVTKNKKKSKNKKNKKVTNRLKDNYSNADDDLVLQEEEKKRIETKDELEQKRQQELQNEHFAITTITMIISVLWDIFIFIITTIAKQINGPSKRKKKNK